MCELDLVKNMVSKLDKLAVFDLNMQDGDDLKALNALRKMNKGSVLVVMPIAYREQEENRSEPLEQPSNFHDYPLTGREQEILALIAGGMTNKMIARELDICDGTVKVHVKNLMRKLKVRSRLEAAVWALGLRIEKRTVGSFENERN